MNRELPTSGQLERDISQKVQKLYRQELEHCPQKITCHFFSNYLAIVIEDAITAVEKSLIVPNNKSQTVERLNSAINDIIKLKIKSIVEEILAVEVDNILFNSTIKNNCAGAIVTLCQLPQLRNPESIPKIKKSKSQSLSCNSKLVIQN